jgi:prevent-host-death family protein
MSETFNLYEAKTHLSDLVERAADGEEIVIAKAGRPLARLVPLKKPPVRRRGGFLKGKIRIAADFDGPLPPALLARFSGREP